MIKLWPQCQILIVAPNEIGAGKGLTKKGRTSQYVGSGDQDANQDNGQSYENLENGQQDDVYENPAVSVNIWEWMSGYRYYLYPLMHSLLHSLILPYTKHVHV